MNSACPIELRRSPRVAGMQQFRIAALLFPLLAPACQHADRTPVLPPGRLDHGQPLPTPPPASPRWSDVKVESGDGLPIHSNVTLSGDATIIFDDFVIGLDDSSDPLAVTRIIRVRMQPGIHEDAELFGYAQVLRGAISGDEGTAVTIAAIYAGAPHTLQLPVFSAEAPPDASAGDTASASTAPAPAPVPQWGGAIARSTITDFHRFPRSRGPGLFFELPPYEATIVIAVTRTRPEQSIQVHLDALDVTMLYLPPVVMEPVQNSR